MISTWVHNFGVAGTVVGIIGFGCRSCGKGGDGHERSVGLDELGGRMARSSVAGSDGGSTGCFANAKL